MEIEITSQILCSFASVLYPLTASGRLSLTRWTLSSRLWCPSFLCHDPHSKSKLLKTHSAWLCLLYLTSMPVWHNELHWMQADETEGHLGFTFNTRRLRLCCVCINRNLKVSLLLFWLHIIKWSSCFGEVKWRVMFYVTEPPHHNQKTLHLLQSGTASNNPGHYHDESSSYQDVSGGWVEAGVQ